MAPCRRGWVENKTMPNFARPRHVFRREVSIPIAHVVFLVLMTRLVVFLVLMTRLVVFARACLSVHLTSKQLLIICPPGGVPCGRREKR